MSNIHEYSLDHEIWNNKYIDESIHYTVFKLVILSEGGDIRFIKNDLQSIIRVINNTHKMCNTEFLEIPTDVDYYIFLLHNSVLNGNRTLILFYIRQLLSYIPYDLRQIT